jgi:hypothetical protein
VLTSARIAARICSGSSGQAATIGARSGSILDSCSFGLVKAFGQVFWFGRSCSWSLQRRIALDADKSRIAAMGYDLYITRKNDRCDDEGPDISRDEWLRVVDEDPELRLAGYNGPYFAIWSATRLTPWRQSPR